MKRKQRFAAVILCAGVLLSPAAAPPAAAIAEGQAHADYLAWLARSPDARARVLGFKAFLEFQGLQDVVPMWQLVRTASMWRDCAGPRFEVAPFSEWPHIATTLRFVQRHVEPVIGEVEAVSGYRNPDLNQCSGGVPASAHRHFFALDLVPERNLGRGEMIRSICSVHGLRGRQYDVGLGFYSGVRFHLDSKGYRRWGADGKGSTSPCATV